MEWQPLSLRTGRAVSDGALFEGAPPHLEPLLRDWLQRNVSDGYAQHLALVMRVPDVGASAERLARFAAADQLIDLIDAALHFAEESDWVIDYDIDSEDVAFCDNDPNALDAAVGQLTYILDTGGSAWRVADMALERRVDDTVTEAVATAALAGGPNPAVHLRAAWEHLYGVNPDASRAYAEAVKAAEAAMIPVVIPDSSRATLGMALKALENAPNKFTFSIPDGATAEGSADPAIALARALWRGQLDRHGGSGPTPSVPFDAAEAAVHSAAWLVHVFGRGLVQRRDVVRSHH